MATGTVVAPSFARQGKAVVIASLLGLSVMWWSALSKNRGHAPVQSGAKVHQLDAREGAGDTVGPRSIGIPVRIERDILEPAIRDPFVAYALPETVQYKHAKKSPPLAPVLAVLPPAVSVPSPPPLNLRFVGQMITPHGDKAIYVASGDGTILLTQGQTLANGYSVTRIDDRHVSFTFAPLEYTTQLALPAPPRYEIR